MGKGTRKSGRRANCGRNVIYEKRMGWEKGREKTEVGM